MSMYTKVTVIVPLDFEDKMQAHVAEFQWERSSGLWRTGCVGPTSEHGRSLFTGEFNYLPAEDFIAHLAAFDWPYPESTVVIIRPEEGSLIVWTPPQPDLGERHYFQDTWAMRFIVGNEEMKLVAE